MGLEALRVHPVSVPFDASCNEAEGLTRALPERESQLRVTGNVEDHLFVVRYPLNPCVEGLLADLVKVTTVGEVYRKPVDTGLREYPALCEVNLGLDVVCPLLVEVRDRVDPAPKIHVVRDEELLGGE